MKFRHSLFFKIYLTIIASLALVAVLLGLSFVVFQDRQEAGWGARRDRFVEAMFPAGQSPGELQATVQKLSQGFGADIAVYDTQGGLLASAGETVAIPPELRGVRRPRDVEDGSRLMVIALPGDRVLVARGAGEFGPPRRHGLLLILLVAAGTGLAAWPVARHLTRRLENLRHGVEAWGTGALDARISERGHDEVAAVARSFNQAAGRVESMMAAQRALLANASHELRSPLARLRLAVELDGRGQSTHAVEIVRNLAELDALVDEILLSSRLEHDGLTLDREPVDLLAVAAEEAALAGIDVTGAPATIAGDRRLIARMVRNLVANAMRHGAPPVQVSARPVGRSLVRLAVEDAGEGLAQGDEARVFEPFYRPGGRGEDQGGWGLGLALVRQIAEQHGGSAGYEAGSGGRGSIFYVDLPVA